MTVYPCCNINRDIVIMSSDIVSLAAYLEWSESVGYNGDNTQCWDCWCKRSDTKKALLSCTQTQSVCCKQRYAKVTK